MGGEGDIISGTLRTGSSSCVCSAQYHTNAIVVSDFTIVTRKWVKLYKLKVTHSKNVMLATMLKGGLLGMHAHYH